MAEPLTPALRDHAARWNRYLRNCGTAASNAQPLWPIGRLTRINGLVMEAAGLKLPLGSSCRVYPLSGSAIEAEVVGFAGEKLEKNLHVAFPEELLIALPADKREALLSALSQDPWPAYQQDGEQYGFEFSGFDVRFSVDGDILTVFDVAPAGSQKLK